MKNLTRILLFTLLGIFAIGLIGSLMESKKPEATVNQPLPNHELLKQSGPESGSFVNLWFLTKGLSRDTNEIKKVATVLIKEYCANQTCNQVYLYRAKEALDLLDYKQAQVTLDNFGYNKTKWLKAEYQWKEKHWRYVCENIAAAYDNNSGELEYEPYLDSDYREHGGKLKRTTPHTTMLNLELPKFHL